MLFFKQTNKVINVELARGPGWWEKTKDYGQNRSVSHKLINYNLEINSYIILYI